MRMLKLSFRSRFEFVLVTGLLLCSCNEGDGLVTRDEVTDIADDAIDASDIGSQLEQLKSRVDTLEQRADQDDRSIKLLLDTGQDELDREVSMERRLAALESRLGT